VPEYLVEMYVARSGRAAVEAAASRASRATSDLSREGRAVRYVRSLFLPDDETCFLLYEADSIDDVRAAAALADLPVDRVTEAVSDGAAEPPD
jgi:hypothetical protein